MRPPVMRENIKLTIQRWIAEQGLRPGDRIASQNDLAAHFNTTAVTVIRALRELSAEGVLHRVNGRGTFVGPPGAPRIPEICLVLPQAHLEDPRHNPDFWDHVQTMHRAFLSAAGASRLFSLRVVPRELDPASVVGHFSHYEAVFFHYSDRPEAFLLRLINERRVPVVVFGQPHPSMACLTIDHDSRQEARLAVDYLFGLGYRRIAYVGVDEPWCGTRTAGYAESLKQARVPYDEARVVQVDALYRTEGEQAAKTLLKRRLPCDAIFCASDVLAHGVLQTLAHAGVRVPEDVGVMGFDGIHALVNHAPHLTTVAIPYPREIQRALDIISAHPTRRHTPRRHLNVLGEIISGRTTRRTHP